MDTIHQGSNAPVIPTAHDVALAEHSSRLLARYLSKQPVDVKLRLVENGRETDAVAVPASALQLFIRLLAEMAHGHAVTLLPIHTDLTTQQAADLLNVSRPYLVRLLEEEKIPYHRVGTHRRVQVRDVLAYKARTDADRREALDALAAEAQNLGLGY
jgi:excisionase family DNA binding protein